MPQLPKTLTAFIVSILKAYRYYFIALHADIVISVIAATFSSYMIKVLIDKANALGDQSVSLLLQPAVIYIGLSLIIALSWRVYDYLFIKLLPQIKRDITSNMFNYLEKHSHSYFMDQFAGSISNKIFDMTKSIDSLVNTSVSIIFYQLISLLVVSSIMYTVHPLFAFIMLLWAFAFLGLSFFCSRKTQHLSLVFAESRSIMAGKIVDSITNITNVRLFARRHFEQRLLGEQLNDTTSKDFQMGWAATKLRILQDVLIIILFSAMMGGLLYLLQYGQVTAGDFAFILSASLNMMQGLWYLMSRIGEMAQNIGVCRQALSLISIPHGIVDVPDAKSLNVTKGLIQFTKVCFSYVKNKPIFTSLNVTIPPKEKVGLVGFSGSGKSTFVHLILRYFDIQAGCILIDDQDISKVTQDSLRSQISMIPQDTSLFHRSLIENIRYGRLEASSEEVIEAAKKAHCHEFIEQLENGYNSIVGERGIKLSGGQRQRIAIARAILKNAPLLILDEATSALDSVTERKIQESLDYLMKDRTTIVIAHRLSTLLHMDRILVFDQGHIIEDGTHQMLLQNGGHYAKLWNMQVGGFLPDDEETEEEKLLSTL